MDSKHIAYCGVDCSVCPDLADHKCPGCRETVWPEGDACLPVACCQGRGISCCGACVQFPCGDMATFYEESDSHRQVYERMKSVRETMGG